MTIIIIFKGDSSIRGFLRRWFIEPKPNIFISSISNSHALKIMNHIGKNKAKEVEYMMFASCNSSQGFTIFDQTEKHSRKKIHKNNFTYDLTEF